LEGKPFALIGVNLNLDGAKKLKEVMDKEKLPWRSFADGVPIALKWNLYGTPTLYVLDHKGVIRYKWMGNPDEKAIDAALEKLIKEAERDGKNTPKCSQPETRVPETRVSGIVSLTRAANSTRFRSGVTGHLSDQ
jgi:hypothetical protein